MLEPIRDRVIEIVRGYDRDGIRFATWVGHGRDPEVAYLDETQLVIGLAEPATEGWSIVDTATAYNTLGGGSEGPLDPAIRHRITHLVIDRQGAHWFGPGSGEACRPASGVCSIALRTPGLSTPYRDPGFFHLDSDFALQWVIWGEPGRAGLLRRAVYLDDRYLLEAAVGDEHQVRVWPCRGLRSAGLEWVTPTALQAAVIEERIRDMTGAG